jgi:hypothetical protein
MLHYTQFFPLRWALESFFCFELVWNCSLPHLNLLCSWDNRYTLLYLTIGWDGISWNFWLGWPQTVILPISASHVVRITGVNHQCIFLFFLSLLLRKVMEHICVCS